MLSRSGRSPGTLLALGLLAAALLHAEPADQKVEFSDPDYRYTVMAPAGWSLFPAGDLPPDLRALFYEIGPDGEATGASLSVRVYPEQVHSDLDFGEFVGLYQLNVRSLGLESEQMTRRDYGSGSKQRTSLEYSVEEEGQTVWYKQMFYRVGDDDVLLLSAKQLFEARERSVEAFNEFFDTVQIEASSMPSSTPMPLDLPAPTELGTP